MAKLRAGHLYPDRHFYGLSNRRLLRALLALTEPGGPKGECRLWRGPLNGQPGSGYPMVRVRPGTPAYAHRLVCELVYGPIPDGWEVHHQCDTRACILPEHLQAASGRSNRAESRYRRSLQRRIHKLEQALASYDPGNPLLIQPTIEE
jgi:hypothetical protein